MSWDLKKPCNDNNVSKSYLILTVLVTLLCLVHIGCFGQEKLVAKNADGFAEYFIIERTLTTGHSAHGNCDYIQVWTVERAVPGKEWDFRISYTQSLEKQGVNTTGYGLFEKNMLLTQVNCKNKKYRLIKAVDYDINGKVIETHSRTDSEAEWDDIVPESVNESICDAICNLNKKKKK